MKLKNHTDENQIAGLDYATFLGVLLTVEGTVGIISIGAVPEFAQGGFAVAFAFAAVFGNVLIAKCMGYRAVLSSITQNAGIWLFTLGMTAGGGSIMIGTAAVL